MLGTEEVRDYPLRPEFGASPEISFSNQEVEGPAAALEDLSMPSPLPKNLSFQLAIYSKNPHGRCSPLNPGENHAFRDTVADVVVTRDGSIAVIAGANAAERGVNWEQIIKDASQEGRASSKEALARLCAASAGSLGDAYKQVLSPLLGERPVACQLDDTKGLVDALDKNSLTVPNDPAEFNEFCNFIKKMESATTFLLGCSKGLSETIRILGRDGWVNRPDCSTSNIQLSGLISELTTLQNKIERACSQLEGERKDRREAASESREKLNNALSGAGLLLTVMGELLPGLAESLPGPLASFKPYLVPLGVGLLALAYYRKGRRSNQ